jgi:hypothetical protein
MSIADSPRRAIIRKGFEDWVKSTGECPLKSCGAVYLSDSHRDAWVAWESAIDATGALQWEALRKISRDERADVMSSELAAANKAIAGLESSLRWIPVGERLPDENVPVLVVVHPCWAEKGPYHEIGMRWKDHWQVPGDASPVTHWSPLLPLPEPPC